MTKREIRARARRNYRRRKAQPQGGRFCACGCGEVISTGRHFIADHGARALRKERAITMTDWGELP